MVYIYLFNKKIECALMCTSMSTTHAWAHYYVTELNKKLKDDWSVNFMQDGRLFYCNHATQTSSWLPPSENWDVKVTGLPYGWEIAIDKDGKQYFINHLSKSTTYEDPRKDVVDEPPKPREVDLIRDSDMGFGFVAGSEKPVIVRFVTEGGPSAGKLLPGDQILRVNGEDVKKAPRDHVIELVRACKYAVTLTVCQPHAENSCRKSALLSAAKKARLKSNPSRVRFAEGVVINGSPMFSPSSYSTESYIPFMPNVLKVFLENGQTKSFKYDGSTLVQDVLESLQQKLSIKCIEHFSLLVEHIKSLRRNKLTLLDPKECLAKIAARPGAQHLRCLFRVAFVPKDAYDLLKKDPVTFEYLYMQCCNDVVQERYAPELKYDIALRLAALHIQQHVLSSSPSQGKISIKVVERECGLERFVPVSLIETMKLKELRKLLSHFLKLNQGLSAPGQKSLSALQAKLHYLRIISELPSYGTKCFTANLRDSNTETVILVSPKFGISQISGVHNNVPMMIADVDDLSGISVSREDDLSQRVELRLKDPDRENILLTLEDRDSEELVLLLQGYYRLLTNRPLPIEQDKDHWAEDGAPPYHAHHTVQEAGWNYVDGDDVNGRQEENKLNVDGESVKKEHLIDLASNPPPYQANKAVTVNGHVGVGTIGLARNGADITNQDRVMVSSLEGPVDRNMNRMHYMQQDQETLAGNRTEMYVSSVPQTTTMNSATSSRISSEAEEGLRNELSHMVALSSEFRHVVELEIKDNDDGSKGKSVGEPLNSIGQGHHVSPEELISDDAVRRVVEMQQIVFDAESYLTEEEVTDTEHDYSRGDSTQDFENMPKLKAADSLLLLTQVGRETELDEVVKNIHIGENEPSESDTDSINTPTDSPSHRSEQRRLSSRQHHPVIRSCSSFGLHSPDNLPADVKLERTNLQDIIQKLHERQLPYPFAEGTLYLDPDIIDLTMIPPPITPDQEEAPTPVSFPPTPFADRQTLEAELIHGLLASNPQYARGHQQKSGDYDERLDNRDLLDHCDALENVDQGTEWIPNEDIDRFIASVTVPPPPTTVALGSFTFKEHSPVQELTQEEISAFIIPPPPASSSSDTETEMISRLQSVAESVEKMVHCEGSMETYGSDKTRLRKEVKENDQRDRSLTEMQQNPEVKLFLAGEIVSSTCDSINMTQHGDSSGYETYASSAISSMDIQQTRRALNNSFSDNSSTISCSSSSTADMAGSHADTEDNALDGELPSNSPMFGTTGHLRHIRKLEGNSKHTTLQTHHSLSVTSTSNGLTSPRPLYPNGIIMPSAGVVGGRGIGYSTSHVRCSSSSSDDGPAETQGVTNSGSPRRQSSIPRHQGSSTLTPRKAPRTSQTRMNRNRSSSTDNLNGATIDDNRDNGELSIKAKNGIDSSPSLGESVSNNWSASTENLATAAATAATDRRTGATPKSPTSPVTRSPCKSAGSKPLYHVGDSVDTGTILKSPAKERSHLGNNKIPKPATSVAIMQEGSLKDIDKLCPEDSSPKDKYGTLRERKVNGESQKIGEPSKVTGNESQKSRTGKVTFTTTKPLPANGSLVGSCSRNATFSKIATKNLEQSQVTTPKKQSHMSSRLPRSKGTSDSRTEVTVDSPSFCFPLHTSSPKMSSLHRSKMIISPNNNNSGSNISNNNNNNLNDSTTYESQCVTVDVVENASGNIICQRDRRDSFYGAEEAIGNMLLRLDDVLNHCSRVNSQVNHQENGSKEKILAAKEALVSASKQFVTASKLFVKGATESEDKLVECLVQCLDLMDQMFVTTERLALCSSSPLQMQNLVLKVKDVAFTFLQTLQAASESVGKDMTHPSINLLMQQATTLAAVLTALMRTLRVFSP